MYSNLVFYLSTTIDTKLLFCIYLSFVLAFIVYYFVLHSINEYGETLESAIDKWYSGKELTKKEEKIFYEYAELQEKLGY